MLTVYIENVEVLGVSHLPLFCESCFYSTHDILKHFPQFLPGIKPIAVQPAILFSRE